MCGRYSNAKNLKKIARKTRAVEPIGLFAPRYNIAPTQLAPVIYNDDCSGPTFKLMRWGLIPAWAQDDSGGGSLINARIETVATKPVFRQAWEKRHCLVPADSFYEWQVRAGQRQPFRLLLTSEEPFCFAGLWERWTPPPAALNPAAPSPAPVVETFTLMTTAANEFMRPLHERMPVIIGPDYYDRWLTPDLSTDVEALLAHPEPEPWKVYPVSPLVNSPATDDLRCFSAVPLDRDFFETQWWSDS